MLIRLLALLRRICAPAAAPAITNPARLVICRSLRPAGGSTLTERLRS